MTAGLPSRSRSEANRLFEPPYRTGFQLLTARTSFARIHERRMVDQTDASWNHIGEWITRLDALRQVAYQFTSG